MRRARWMVALAAMLAWPAHAEDSVALFGNYYKERSTRVISPMVTVRKELPEEVSLQVTYLVDQITSASGAFTVTDEPFSEIRQEVRGTVGIELFERVTPSLNARYSHEGDYQSVGAGGAVVIRIDPQTSLTVRGQHLFDVIRQRDRRGFRDTLHTTFLAAQATRDLSPVLIAGGTLEARVQRGYQENPYRVETHPRDRDRFAISGFAAYRWPSTRTTLRGDLCYYWDSWDLNSISAGVTVTQRLLRSLEIQPQLRVHTQSSVRFRELTADPKLRELDTTFVGARLIWRLDFLARSALTSFRNAEVRPSYYYFHQNNRYGAAHIAQLGFYWPF